MKVCYEAHPTGYGLYRQLTAAGVACTVVALAPRRSGDRVNLTRQQSYADLRVDFFHRRDQEQVRRQAVKRLEGLVYHVMLATAS